MAKVRCCHSHTYNSSAVSYCSWGRHQIFVKVYNTSNDLALVSLSSFVIFHSPLAFKALEIGTHSMFVEWKKWNREQTKEKENSVAIDNAKDIQKNYK